MAELGITVAQGNAGLKELLKIIASEQDARLPVDAHTSLVVLAAELQAMQTLIGSVEKRIMAQHRSSEASQRLESIPGIGVVGATAIAATVADPKVFRSGRDFAAWIGIESDLCPVIALIISVEHPAFASRVAAALRSPCAEHCGRPARLHCYILAWCWRGRS